MPEPDQSVKRRKKLLSIVARVFAELGYVGATTAEVAQRCAVREKIPYRLRPGMRSKLTSRLICR